MYPVGPLCDHGIFVDASTSWGIGLIIADSWHAFQLVTDWKLPGHDICWLESVALELVFYFLRQLGFSNTHLLIHSDNNGAIGGHSKHRSRSVPINLSVRRTYNVLTECIIIPSFAYIESAQNPADPISRGESGSPTRNFLPRFFDMPVELRSFFLPDE